MQVRASLFLTGAISARHDGVANMGALQTCLTALAVLAWAHNDAARAAVDKAIDGYLRGFQRPDHQSALIALKQAYQGLKLDSHVAVEIDQHLEQRLAYLTSRGPGPALMAISHRLSDDSALVAAACVPGHRGHAEALTLRGDASSSPAPLSASRRGN